MKRSIKMFDGSNYCDGGALTTLQQYEPGNFFFIVTNFETEQKEMKGAIRNERPYFTPNTLFSEVTTFDSERAHGLNIPSNVKSVLEEHFLDLYAKPLPANHFKVKAKVKSVQHKIPKIPPIEDYLL